MPKRARLQKRIIFLEKRKSIDNMKIHSLPSILRIKFPFLLLRPTIRYALVIKRMKNSKTGYHLYSTHF